MNRDQIKIGGAVKITRLGRIGEMQINTRHLAVRKIGVKGTVMGRADKQGCDL